MKPGTYLQKRRRNAGLSLREAATLLAGLPGARHVRAADLERLAERLADAEADRDNLTHAQAWLLALVVPMDVGVYQDLLVRHWAGPASFLPLPQVCRHCACSWHDACHTPTGPCAWESADLCTACAAPPAHPAQHPQAAGTQDHARC